MQTKANMTDRELLEAAAKAAGYMLGRHSQDDCKLTFGGKEWNPLEDDGDALRLAVKLRINIQFSGARYGVSGLLYMDICCECPDSDRPVSIRRAIVRAAAEMAAE